VLEGAEDATSSQDDALRDAKASFTEQERRLSSRKNDLEDSLFDLVTKGPPNKDFAFIDTHCHLDEVLQTVRRHIVAPTLGKFIYEFTKEELEHWRVLGWVRDEGTVSSPSQPSKTSRSPVWSRFWAELSTAEREAATGLGYDCKRWNTNKWTLPKNKSWQQLDEEMRQKLAVLGETRETWDSWERTEDVDMGVARIDSNDLRDWTFLSVKEQDSAFALGFTVDTWNAEEMADVHEAVSNIFGPNFEGTVAQGCDEHSAELAEHLALSHPQIYASFGCHPKSAWCYNDAFEQKLLSCMKRCGRKAVAWGEFGLDYSHTMFGPMASNRRQQKEVFSRQLRLAVEHGYPLVLHSRGADRDTLRLMRRYIPRHWKVHVHSFRCGQQFLESVLTEYPNAYIGIAGIITMEDPEAHDICRACPLDRMVIETDAPYLPLASSFYSHPGQVPDILWKVAELKALPVEDVFRVARENARAMYGI
jgi:TatD DNase family protein